MTNFALTPRALVVATGMRSALGENAMQAGFLYRTGLPAMAESPFADEEEGYFAACFDAAVVSQGTARITELASGAFAELIGALAATTPLPRSPLCLTLDRQHHQLAPTVTNALVQLARGVELDVDVQVEARGGGGAGLTLERALSRLAGGAELAIWGGVHSDIDPQVIRHMVEKDQLYSSNNLDARVPGEAAAFVALASPAGAKRLELPVLGAIASVVNDVETARPDNDEPVAVAHGLTRAVRNAGAPLEAAQLRAGWVLSDLTYEMARLLEWQSVFVRTSDLLGPPYHLDNPAHRIGSLGAAALPLHTVLASEAWRGGWAPSQVALAFAASEAGERAAMVMVAPS